MSDAFIDGLKSKIQQLENSPEYQENCRKFSEECDHLEAVAAKLLPRRDELEQLCRERTVRQEFASGSDLPRGFYCPSPCVDLIVAGTHRGKLLKRVTSRSHPSHEYGFDCDGRLLYCKPDGGATEYLVYEDDRTYGIAFFPVGDMLEDSMPEYFTEEIYGNGKLLRYTHCLFQPPIPSVQTLRCTNMDAEFYHYDSKGLCGCDMYTFFRRFGKLPPALKGIPFASLLKHPSYSCEEYTFERKDGMICGFTTKSGAYFPTLSQRKA